MFWALFGLGDPNKVSLSPYENQLTETFGLLMYGAYHIASIIVLLNMLIASMTQSYERVLVGLEREKFYYKVVLLLLLLFLINSN